MDVVEIVFQKAAKLSAQGEADQLDLVPGHPTRPQHEVERLDHASDVACTAAPGAPPVAEPTQVVALSVFHGLFCVTGRHDNLFQRSAREKGQKNVVELVGVA